jgi:hypothetical protein
MVTPHLALLALVCETQKNYFLNVLAINFSKNEVQVRRMSAMSHERRSVLEEVYTKV